MNPFSKENFYNFQNYAANAAKYTLSDWEIPFNNTEVGKKGDLKQVFKNITIFSIVWKYAYKCTRTI